ncbi:MAG TPA: pitrilysin family protein [Vicinamibacterales bacterium]|nr:pitrilysin family protein [Vicinamibacterales bacterium]
MIRIPAIRVALVVTAIVASLAMPSAQTSRPVAGVADVPRLPFQTFTLPNGLQVILSQDRRLPLVAVNLWYHVGPANEEPGRTGFAHLFEHLMFQGSKHTPPDSHFPMLEAAGATDINGTTDYDRTNYFETVPSNQLELALWIESDRMGYLLDTVDQGALSNQQDVVRNERRQSVENVPYGVAEEAVVHLLYPKGHPYYGNVIGSHEDIQAAKLADVKDFFKRYYAPNNASLAIVGDFDPAIARTLAQKYFGTLKRGLPVPPINVETPAITSERRLTVEDRVELPRLYMAWLTSPIFKPGDADADIMATLLGGGRSSRLYKKLVYEQQIAQDVSVNQQSLILGSQFQITVTARPGRTLEEIERAVDAELQALRTTAPDPREIERARNTLETRIITGLEGLGGFGGVADRLNSYNHYLKTPEYLQQDIARYRAVTPATVLAFAKAQLTPASRVVVHAIKGTPNLSSPPTPAQAPSTPGQGAESVNVEESWRKDPPAPPASRTYMQVPTPESITLSNGLTVMLAPRRGLPVVAANLVVKTGSDSNPTDAPGLANFAAAMLTQGTKTRNALQIADDTAQLGATLAATSTMDATTVSTRSLKKNFSAALDQLADVVLNPSFPADELERQRTVRLGQLAQQRANPQTLAATIVANVLYGEQHPYGYAELGTAASLKAMSGDRLHAFWQQNFVPNNAALIVAGDISMAELRPLAEKAFAAWQRGTPARPTLTTPTNVASKVVIVDRPGAPQTQLRVAMVGAARSAADFRPAQVMNTALGGLFSSRINMNLREKNGYTYGASSQFVFRKAAGPFQVASGVRTDVTGAAAMEMIKELRGMSAAAMPADELKRSKDALTYSLPGAFETSAGTAASLANIYTYDLGLDYYATYAESVYAVTAEQALTAAKKYLVPERFVVVAIGDRSKIEADLRKLNLPIEIRDAEGKLVQ